jgi:hypothetical protein
MKLGNVSDSEAQVEVDNNSKNGSSRSSKYCRIICYSHKERPGK